MFRCKGVTTCVQCFTARFHVRFQSSARGFLYSVVNRINFVIQKINLSYLYV